MGNSQSGVSDERPHGGVDNSDPIGREYAALMQSCDCFAGGMPPGARHQPEEGAGPRGVAARMQKARPLNAQRIAHPEYSLAELKGHAASVSLLEAQEGAQAPQLPRGAVQAKVIKAGVLCRFKDDSRATWGKEFVVVEMRGGTAALKCYRDEKSFKFRPEEPFFTITISASSGVTTSQAEDFKTAPFVLHLEGREDSAARPQRVSFGCESQEQRADWILALQHVISGTSAPGNAPLRGHDDDNTAVGLYDYAADKAVKPFRGSAYFEINVNKREKFSVVEMRGDGWALVKSLSPHATGEVGWAPGNYLSRDGVNPLASEDMQRAIQAHRIAQAAALVQHSAPPL